MREYLQLFLVFAKIGVMTFGGGAAMLPMLQRELVDSLHWVTMEDLMDYYAIGQCTPGIIAVNTATFVGQKRKGTLGAIAATCGMIFPSFLIISVLARVIDHFSDLLWVQNAFAGIRACVCAQIACAVIKLGKKSLLDWPAVLIFILTAIGSLALDLSPVVFVLVAAAAGIGIQAIRARKQGEKQ